MRLPTVSVSLCNFDMTAVDGGMIRPPGLFMGAALDAVCFRGGLFWVGLLFASVRRLSMDAVTGTETGFGNVMERKKVVWLVEVGR